MNRDRTIPPLRLRGFTLIELLVVIAIIGLLSSIVLASLNTARSRARDAARESDIHALATALDFYYDANGQYPSCGAFGGGWSSWTTGSHSCWPTLVPTTYISSVPKDPQNIDLGACGTTANCHIYEYCPYNSFKNYVLAVNLENPNPRSQSNPSSENSGCANGGPNYYWVSR